MALDLPSGLVPCVRETALLLYGAAVEALHLALTEAGDAGADVRRHDERVRRLSGLLEQLGWPGEEATAGRRLSGPCDLLADVLQGALIDAGERLAVACDAAARGEADADGVRSAAAEVIALDRLLREVDGA